MVSRSIFCLKMWGWIWFGGRDGDVFQFGEEGKVWPISIWGEGAKKGSSPWSPTIFFSVIALLNISLHYWSFFYNFIFYYNNCFIRYGGGCASFGSDVVNVESWRCVSTLRAHNGGVYSLHIYKAHWHSFATHI